MPDYLKYLDPATGMNINNRQIYLFHWDNLPHFFVINNAGTPLQAI
ncbi:hypothetical protein SAMN04488055_5114 [Chitinophaga niabensis]|uniref:Uncharacterized protein n=1 Tax=Chitinophaga niabensis TaxID=536979 RepID=A0A1N6K5U2_9BACT|nr:hypothetical protein SAMN04488055_5114 [Chitinophaga niabensis]